MFRNTLLLIAALFSLIETQAQGVEELYLGGNITNTQGQSIQINIQVDTEPVTFDNTFSQPGGFFYANIALNGPDWSTMIVSFTNCDGNTVSQIIAQDTTNIPNPQVDYYIGLNYCNALDVYGCTDPAASNYNPDANVDDGTCIYEDCEGTEYLLTVSSESFGNSLNYELIYNNEYFSGSTSGNSSTISLPFCLEDGCGTLILEPSDQNSGGTYFNFTTGFDSFDSGQIYPGEQVFVNFGNQENCQTQNIHFGCIDNEALNFNPWATVDNGNCEYEETEEVENDLCEDAAPLLEGLQLISNEGAISNEGIFGDCWAFGNGKGEQSSVWYTFTTPEEPAAITIEAITDGTNTFTDTQFGLFDECGGEMIYCDGNSGEGLMSKFEFACGELEPNTTYILLVDGYQGDNGTCYLEYTVDGSCEGSDECEANPALVNIVTNTWSEEISWAILQEGEIVAEGSGYEENNYQYTEEICLEDGCYTFEMYDSYGDGWNGGEFSIWLENGTFITSGELETGEYGSVTFGVNADCEEEIEGCIDPEAINYNPEATVDDGSCEYSDCEANEILVQLNAGPGALMEWSFENAEEYLEGGGYDGQGAIEEYTFCVEDGCYNFTIYDFSDGNWTGLICIYINGEVYLIEQVSNDSNLSFDIPVNSNCSDEIEGCTDPEAENYNEEATVDDGSCEYADCTPVEFIHDYTSSATDASFPFEIVNAGGEVVASGSLSGTGGSDNNFCLADGCYTLSVSEIPSEWTGIISINIGEEFWQPNFFFEIVPDENGSFSENFSINDTSCLDEVIEGCTVWFAENYNPEANVYDGSCIFDADCEDNQTVLFIQNGQWIIQDEAGNTVNQGGTTGFSSLINPICLSDGCYTIQVSSIGNYPASFELYEDTELLASGENNNNYNLEFGINCGGEIEGCTDPEAENYNPEATIDDGSCIYPSECSISFDLTADSLNLNTLFVIPSDSIGDAVGLLWDFGDGTTSTELFPDHEYEGDGPYNLCLTVFFEVGETDTCDATFCMEITADMIPDLIPGAGGNSAGFFINIIEDASTIGIEEEQHLESIEVYPNPATDFVMLSSNVHWKNETTVTVYNVHGAILNSQIVNFDRTGGEHKVDLSEYSSGLYFINVSTRSEYKTFKILKN